jgi:serine/threonine protein kinase
MAQTVQDVYGLLLRSGLVPPDDARSLLGRWQADARDRDRGSDSHRFVSWLVANKHLTDYQGALLVRGFCEGFFLNDYKVLDRIGRGRMAGVYKAQHRLGQVVAIKVLPPSKAREANLKGRFLREARLAMRLKHPNVVRAFQVGEAAGLHYLVMEHLEGETLADQLDRRGKLPPGEAVRLTHQALLGLQHIYEEGLVHRDLKPSNLMLVFPGGVPAADTYPATVKVLDIGLGRPLLEEVPPGDETALTTEGVVLGTPDYMAPEQARDARAADIRSDIYSLGCVLFHALTGRQPFLEPNLLSLMIRHATEEPQPLRELNPAVSDGLQQIVSRMMAKDPADRYPTPERAARALEVFLASAADTPAGPESDAGMRDYLGWLETQVIHADLPPWLAEMDTVTAAEVRQARAELAEPPRPPAPPKPAKTVRPVEPPPTPTEKTKLVRKIRAGRPAPHGAPAPAREAPAPVAAPAPPPAAKALLPDFELLPAPPADVRDGPPAPPGRRIGRREVIVFALGAAAGALATRVGLWIARAY